MGAATGQGEPADDDARRLVFGKRRRVAGSAASGAADEGEGGEGGSPAEFAEGLTPQEAAALPKLWSVRNHNKKLTWIREMHTLKAMQMMRWSYTHLTSERKIPTNPDNIELGQRILISQVADRINTADRNPHSMTSLDPLRSDVIGLVIGYRGAHPGNG